MNTSSNRSCHTRLRRLAVGAVVVGCAGVGGLGFVHADDAETNLVYVPAESCRLLDTRDDPGFGVGPRRTPLEAGTEWTVDVRDYAGDCAGQVPDEAAAIVVNATLADATAPTYLSMYAAGDDQPVVSNNNMVPGMIPTPNQSIVRLIDGEYTMFLGHGTANIFVDLWGWFVPMQASEAPPGSDDHADLLEKILELQAKDAQHDQKDQELQDLIDDLLDHEHPDLGEKLADLEEYVENLQIEIDQLNQKIDNLAVTGLSFSRETIGEPIFDKGQLSKTRKVYSPTGESMVSVEMTAPAAGTVTVTGDINVYGASGKNYLKCQVGTEVKWDGDVPTASSRNLEFAMPLHLSTTRMFEIAEGETVTYHLVCFDSFIDPNDLDYVEVSDPVINATFNPAGN